MKNPILVRLCEEALLREHVQNHFGQGVLAAAEPLLQEDIRDELVKKPHDYHSWIVVVLKIY